MSTLCIFTGINGPCPLPMPVCHRYWGNFWLYRNHQGGIFPALWIPAAVGSFSVCSHNDLDPAYFPSKSKGLDTQSGFATRTEEKAHYSAQLVLDTALWETLAYECQTENPSAILHSSGLVIGKSQWVTKKHTHTWTQPIMQSKHILARGLMNDKYLSYMWKRQRATCTSWSWPVAWCGLTQSGQCQFNPDLWQWHVMHTFNLH